MSGIGVMSPQFLLSIQRILGRDFDGDICLFMVGRALHRGRRERHVRLGHLSSASCSSELLGKEDLRIRRQLGVYQEPYAFNLLPPKPTCFLVFYSHWRVKPHSQMGGSTFPL